MTQNTSRSDSTTLSTQTYSFGEKPFRVEACVAECGRDLVVICGGGTRYHTGAVAVATVNPKIKNSTLLEATATTVGIPGHKEDQIAREAALRLSKKYQVTTTLAVGIHVDDASSKEIDILVSNFYNLIDTIIERFRPATSE